MRLSPREQQTLSELVRVCVLCASLCVFFKLDSAGLDQCASGLDSCARNTRKDKQRHSKHENTENFARCLLSPRRRKHTLILVAYEYNSIAIVDALYSYYVLIYNFMQT